MRLNTWKISTLVSTGALALVIGGSFVREAGAEPQPNMKAALGHLVSAAESLAKATADKGGHRLKAIELTAKAMEETKLGMEYDNHH